MTVDLTSPFSKVISVLFGIDKEFSIAIAKSWNKEELMNAARVGPASLINVPNLKELLFSLSIFEANQMLLMALPNIIETQNFDFIATNMANMGRVEIFDLSTKYLFNPRTPVSPNIENVYAILRHAVGGADGIRRGKFLKAKFSRLGSVGDSCSHTFIN